MIVCFLKAPALLFFGIFPEHEYVPVADAVVVQMVTCLGDASPVAYSMLMVSAPTKPPPETVTEVPGVPVAGEIAA